MRNRDSKLIFDPEWRTSLATAVLLPGLIVLGFWQLERAAEKSALAATWEARGMRQAVGLDELDWSQAEALAYTRVTEARIEDGKTLLLLQSGYSVLAQNVTGLREAS